MTRREILEVLPKTERWHVRETPLTFELVLRETQARMQRSISLLKVNCTREMILNTANIMRGELATHMDGAA